MSNSLHRLWDHGQQLLASGHYLAARRLLQAAEALAWRDGDLGSLARIYLPLLEVRRLIRYQALEGTIVMAQAHPALPATGTILIASRPLDVSALRRAQAVYRAAERMHQPLEALLLIPHKGATVLVSPGGHFSQNDVGPRAVPPTAAEGLRIQWTTNPGARIPESTRRDVSFPLPPPGVYPPSHPLHALARESLLIAWEALALKWQHRHRPSPRTTPLEELAWLRQTLCIDPACEPATMRLMALAENIQRGITVAEMRGHDRELSRFIY